MTLFGAYCLTALVIGLRLSWLNWREAEFRADPAAWATIALTGLFWPIVVPIAIGVVLRRRGDRRYR